MSTVTARKNVETDNPKFTNGMIPCLVKKTHIKEEFLDLYELFEDSRTSVAKVPFEHLRRQDDHLFTLIEPEEAYDLYLEGYVVLAHDMKDPRPREALLPYMTPKQKEAQAYLDGKNHVGDSFNNHLPAFVEGKAYEIAVKQTKENREAVKAKALRGE